MPGPGQGIGVGAVGVTPAPRVAGFTIATRAAVLGAAQNLPAAPDRPVPEYVKLLLPTPGVAATQVENAAAFFKTGFGGVNFGAGGPRDQAVFTGLTLIAIQAQSSAHPDNASAIDASLRLLRAGVEARFPQHAEIGSGVLLSAGFSWIRQVSATADLLTPDAINDLVANASITPTQTAVQDIVREMVKARLGSSRDDVAHVIYSDPTFEYPVDLAPTNVDAVDLPAQVNRITALYTAPDQFASYGAVYGYCNADARRFLEQVSQDRGDRILYLVGRKMLKGAIPTTIDAVSTEVMGYLEALLSYGVEDFEAIAGILTEETGAAITLPTELTPEDLHDFKAQLLANAGSVAWNEGATIADHNGHMKSLVELIQSEQTLLSIKIALMRMVDSAQILLLETASPDFQTHISPAEVTARDAYNDIINKLCEQIAEATNPQALQESAVRSALAPIRAFTKGLLGQLKARRNAPPPAAVDANAGGNGGGGDQQSQQQQPDPTAPATPPAPSVPSL